MRLFFSAILIALMACSAAAPAFAKRHPVAMGRHGPHLKGPGGPYQGLKYRGNV
jgi:hypothetical protein